jgi:hypothetical protein
LAVQITLIPETISSGNEMFPVFGHPGLKINENLGISLEAF